MTDISDLGFLVARIFLSAVYLYSGIDKLIHRADAIAELRRSSCRSPSCCGRW